MGWQGAKGQVLDSIQIHFPSGRFTVSVHRTLWYFFTQLVSFNGEDEAYMKKSSIFADKRSVNGFMLKSNIRING